MFKDAVTTIAALSDLHLRCARATGRLPDEHHEPRPYRAAGYVNQTNRNALTSTNTRSHNKIKPRGTSQEGCQVHFSGAGFYEGCQVNFRGAEFNKGCQVDFIFAAFNLTRATGVRQSI